MSSLPYLQMHKNTYTAKLENMDVENKCSKITSSLFLVFRKKNAQQVSLFL